MILEPHSIYEAGSSIATLDSMLSGSMDPATIKSLINGIESDGVSVLALIFRGEGNITKHNPGHPRSSLALTLKKPVPDAVLIGNDNISINLRTSEIQTLSPGFQRVTHAFLELIMRKLLKTHDGMDSDATWLLVMDLTYGTMRHACWISK